MQGPRPGRRRGGIAARDRESPSAARAPDRSGRRRHRGGSNWLTSTAAGRPARRRPTTSAASPPTRTSTTKTSRRCRWKAHLDRLLDLRDVDVGRPLGRRLHLRRHAVLSRPDRLAGADLDDGRHPRRLLPDEPDRPAVAALRHPLPGHGAGLVRRDGRQPRRESSAASSASSGTACRPTSPPRRCRSSSDLRALGAGADQQRLRGPATLAGSASCSCGSSSL